MNIKSIASSLIISLVFLLTSSPKALTSGLCLDVWNNDCDLFPDEIIPEVLPSEYEVFIKNKFNKTIWVAVHYKKHLHINKNNGWVTKHWWSLAPGESKKILGDNGTRNRYIYFYATTNDLNTTWGGNDTFQYLPFGKQNTLKKVGFFKAYMGKHIGTYTQSFK